jgi:hypothetical protein
MAFDDTTKETTISKPFRWAASGTVTARVYFIMASATSGKVDFEIAVEAITAGDALDLDTSESFDTVNTGTAPTVPGTAGYLGTMDITLTNKDSAAAGDYVRLSLARDAADGTNDTATGDAYVLLVTLLESA